MSQSPAQREHHAILARVDLVRLADALVGRGHNGMWPCPNPDHAQTGLSPPLNVFVGDDGGQRWHCFGCSDGGTAIDLLLRSAQARQRGVSHVSDRAPLVADAAEALEWLARAAHMAPAANAGSGADSLRDKRERRWWELDMLSYVKVCAARLREPRAAAVRRWLTERRAIPDPVIDAACLGFDPGYRALPREDGIPTSPAIVVPIREPCDATPGWRVIYTLHRLLRPRPGRSRWLNTASRLARNPGVGFFDPPVRTRSGLVVTEGPIDALSANAAGYRAAALLGASAGNLRVAGRLADSGEPLLLAFDNDEAGERLGRRLEALLGDNTDATWDRLRVPERYNDLNEWHVACRQEWRGVLGAGVRLSRSRPASVRLPPVVSL